MEERRKKTVSHLTSKEWVKSITAYAPQAIFISLIAVTSFVVRLHYFDKDADKRLLVLESKVIKQWSDTQDIRQKINIKAVEESKHTEQSKEAILNIKGRVCEMRDRMMRLEGLHLHD